MAVLERIRSKGVLLVGAVGFALLAFVVGDALNSGSSFFNKSKETLAKIVGEDININDFNVSVEQMIEVYKIETGNSELSEDITNQLRASVWESLVNEKLLNAEAEKLGLAVSKEELSDRCIGNNIHPLIMQRRAFAGENGQFNRSALVQFVSSLEEAPANDEMKDQLAKAKNYWMFWEKTVKNSILQEKYTALLSKSVGANSLDAKMSYQDRKTSVDVNYVLQPYFAIPDASVSVSKDDIKALYNKRKEQFKQEENVSVNFVSFDIKALKEDYKEAEVWINKLSNEFRTTEDIIGLVNSNSDVMYNGQNYSMATVPAALKAFAFSGATGAVVGPIFANDTYTMAKIMQAGILQSDSVKLRHIVLVEKDAVKADSLVTAIRGGANFAELAKKYSAVKQTAANGGEIGWIQDGMPGMDKEMSTAAFSKATNEVFTLKNAQGVQIMQVMEKTPARSKVKLAILERKVIASSRSQSKIYNDAKQFAVDLTSDKFDAKAKEKGYIVRTATDLMASSDKMSDIAQSRKVIQWAFKSDKGDVSDVFECGSTLIVATATEVNEKGYKSVEKVSEQLKAELIRDKKAELMIKNLSAQLAKTPTLEGLAASLNDSVKIASAVSFASYQFGMGGMEPNVIGKVTKAALNKVSAPIKGNAGVYVVRTSNAQVNPQPFDAKMEKLQLNSRMSYSLPYLLLQNLKDKADIVDNRVNFF